MATYIGVAGTPAPGFISWARQALRELGAPAPVVPERAGTQPEVPAPIAVPRHRYLIADDVAGTWFPVSALGKGYRQREVDVFLARAAVSLRERAAGRAGSLCADDVVVAAFPPSRIRPGYDRREVDDFLDRLVEALA